MRVDSARDTVRNFDVELGDNVLCNAHHLVQHTAAAGTRRREDSPWYTLASLISRTAADSTILRTVKRLIALSLGTHREQFEQRTKPTWPRPFLLRPPFLRFLVYASNEESRCDQNAYLCRNRHKVKSEESTSAHEPVHPSY